MTKKTTPRKITDLPEERIPLDLALLPKEVAGKIREVTSLSAKYDELVAASHAHAATKQAALDADREAAADAARAGTEVPERVNAAAWTEEDKHLRRNIAATRTALEDARAEQNAAFKAAMGDIEALAVRLEDNASAALHKALDAYEDALIDYAVALGHSLYVAHPLDSFDNYRPDFEPSFPVIADPRTTWTREVIDSVALMPKLREMADTHLANRAAIEAKRERALRNAKAAAKRAASREAWESSPERAQLAALGIQVKNPYDSWNRFKG